jgi:dimeric dUTPase (all-alpha-NTP-PPase superfamily)
MKHILILSFFFHLTSVYSATESPKPACAIVFDENSPAPKRRLIRKLPLANNTSSAPTPTLLEASLPGQDLYSLFKLAKVAKNGKGQNKIAVFNYFTKDSTGIESEHSTTIHFGEKEQLQRVFTESKIANQETSTTLQGPEALTHLFSMQDRIEWGDVNVIAHDVALKPEKKDFHFSDNVIEASATQGLAMDGRRQSDDWFAKNPKGSRPTSWRETTDNRIAVGFKNDSPLELLARGIDQSSVDGPRKTLRVVTIDYSAINAQGKTVTRGLRVTVDGQKIIFAKLVELIKPANGAGTKPVTTDMAQGYGALETFVRQPQISDGVMHINFIDLNAVKVKTGKDNTPTTNIEKDVNPSVQSTLFDLFNLRKEEKLE